MSPGRLLTGAAALGIVVFSVRGMATEPKADPRPTHPATLSRSFTLIMNRSIYFTGAG
jgi:hypothetical protein